MLINSAGAQLIGREPDEVVGRSDLELLEKSSAEAIASYDRKVMITGETTTLEETVTMDGIARTFLTTKGPYRNEAGEIVGVIGIARDVTEKKREVQNAIEARDLFLSNTVRVHRKLRQAGVASDLHVFEGQSHAQYAGDPSAPETKEHFGELAAFFDKHLAR